MGDHCATPAQSFEHRGTHVIGFKCFNHTRTGDTRNVSKEYEQQSSRWKDEMLDLGEERWIAASRKSGDWQHLKGDTKDQDQRYCPHELGDYCSGKTADRENTIDKFAAVHRCNNSASDAERHNDEK